MAAATEAFVNAVEAALANAEVEMVNNRADEEKTRSGVQEVRSLLRPVALRHFDTRRGFKHKIGDFYSMLKRQAMGWMQHLQRRMSPRCSVKHPWQVVMDDRLPRELFDILEAAVLRTNFGVITAKTKKNCVFAFTYYHRLRKLFSDLTDQILTRESFLKRKVKGGKRVEAIVDADKQFGIKYSLRKEMITFDFYYGFWNEHGWPQHV
ncbi:uncharacterized protein [Acropora muricata]|uniref:uncharacterized protein n=1 Tax=Acropora muricata TaxID=159855 RepID=UPI0034E42E3C